jgi:AraC family transcriptional activator of pobA
MSKSGQPIKHFSSSEYIRLFINKSHTNSGFNHSGVQVYDYEELSKDLKTPTPVFRPDYNFLIYLKQGEVCKQIGTEVKKIKAPAVIVINAGLVISLKEVSADAQGNVVVFENELLNNILSKQALIKLFDIDPVILLDEKSSATIAALGALLLGEQQEPNTDTAIFIPLLQALLQKLLILSGKNEVLSSVQLIALKFKTLVYQHYLREKNVSFYANELAISENYLNRCTQMVLNKSVKKFIIEVSILQSQILLQDMGKSIAEISHELNFEDPSYFSRIFKKINSITPVEYRKRIINDLS